MLYTGNVKINFNKQTIIAIIFFFILVLLFFYKSNKQDTNESYVNASLIDTALRSVKKDILKDLIENKKTNPSLFDEATFNALVLNINKANKEQLKDIIVNGLICLSSGQGHAVRPGLPGSPKIMM